MSLYINTAAGRVISLALRIYALLKRKTRDLSDKNIFFVLCFIYPPENRQLLKDYSDKHLTIILFSIPDVKGLVSSEIKLEDVGSALQTLIKPNKHCRILIKF